MITGWFVPLLAGVGILAFVECVTRLVIALWPDRLREG
jgi:hypothetical protein